MQDMRMVVRHSCLLVGFSSLMGESCLLLAVLKRNVLVVKLVSFFFFSLSS